VSDSITWGEPAPTTNDEEYIQDLVIRDIESRKQHGIDKYGTALQPFNGRSADQDLYEELLDAVMYQKQKILEGSGADKLALLYDDINDWSEAVHGSREDRGPVGALNHLKREAQEAIDDWQVADMPGFLNELSDCLILTLNATWRGEFTLDELLTAAHAKMTINRTRKIGQPDHEGVIEHVRSEDGE
jgi:hypothetical protein